MNPHDTVTKQEFLDSLFKLWNPEPQIEIIPLSEARGRILAEEKNAVARIGYLLTLSALLARPHNVVIVAVFAPGAEALVSMLKTALPPCRRWAGQAGTDSAET